MSVDWTEIPDDSLIQGAPPRATVVTALRDNPRAIAEGAPTAPRIVDAALGSTATNAGRDWVLNRTALADYAAVGTYAFAGLNSTDTVTTGNLSGGSNLRPAGVSAGQSWNNLFPTGGLEPTGQATSLPGTWRAMGVARGAATPLHGATLWLRIA